MGDPADDDWFKQLGTRAPDASAKRLHAALASPKTKDRVKALETLASSVKKPDTHEAVLVGLCKLLDADVPEIVERAALALADYSRLGKKAKSVHHAIFLRFALASIERASLPPHAKLWMR